MLEGVDRRCALSFSAQHRGSVIVNFPVARRMVSIIFFLVFSAAGTVVFAVMAKFLCDMYTSECMLGCCYREYILLCCCCVYLWAAVRVYVCI